MTRRGQGVFAHPVGDIGEAGPPSSTPVRNVADIAPDHYVPSFALSAPRSHTRARAHPVERPASSAPPSTHRTLSRVFEPSLSPPFSVDLLLILQRLLFLSFLFSPIRFAGHVLDPPESTLVLWSTTRGSYSKFKTTLKYSSTGQYIVVQQRTRRGAEEPDQRTSHEEPSRRPRAPAPPPPPHTHPPAESTEQWGPLRNPAPPPPTYTHTHTHESESEAAAPPPRVPHQPNPSTRSCRAAE